MHLAALLNSLILNNFLVESLGFYVYGIISYAVRTVLLLPLQFGMSFISLLYLITVASISNTMMNTSGESGHPCLVPDFKEKLPAFHY